MPDPLRPPRELPHPTSLKKGANWSDLTLIEETRCADPKWHFRLVLRWPMQLGPPLIDGVPALGEPRVLALFRKEDPPADIEVCGHLLDREVDPLHWLEEVLRLQERPYTITSSEPRRLRSGIAGDLVATWTDAGGVRRAGRFFASKWGPRMFLLSGTAALGDYAAIADELFMAIASFEAVDDSLGVLAEPALPVQLDIPLPWRTYIPDAWHVQRVAPEEHVHGFQASSVRGVELDRVDGKLSFGVARRTVAKKPRKAAQMFLNAVRFHDIEMAHEDFAEERAEPPFERSWYCATPCSRGDEEGEMRCRVMMMPQLWVVGGLLGPRREDDCIAWAQNKRALDVVCSTFELL